MIKALSWLEERFEEVACAVLLAALILLLCLQVVLRFAFNMGLAWNEEVERFVFVWFAYLAASLGVQRRGHIRVSSVINLFPPGLARSFFRVFSDLIWFLFNVYVVHLGIEVMRNMAEFRQDSPALGLDLMWVYAIVPLAFLMMSLRLIQLYAREIRQVLDRRRRRVAGEGRDGFRGSW